LRAHCDNAGSLLVFDEVVTGFRVGWQGAQGMFNVTPDLTVLGKVIGGGLPVGAYGGRTYLMQMIAPSGPVYQAGTLSGNPLSMAAGLATLRTMPAAGFGALEERGRQLAEGLEGAAKSAGVPLLVQRVGSMLTPFFTETPVRNFDDAKRSDTSRYAEFFHAMLERGVYVPPSQFEAAFVSLAHTTEDIDAVVTAARHVLERMNG